MTEKRDLLGFYCREYGMEIEPSLWGVANYHKRVYIVPPSSTKYIGMVTVGRLESMSESEIENFVLKCVLESMV